jgi:hypothetical protein
MELPQALPHQAVITAAVRIEKGGGGERNQNATNAVVAVFFQAFDPRGAVHQLRVGGVMRDDPQPADD